MSDTKRKEEICMIFAGSADAGKSTLGGVLLTGELDNGNGKARVHMARHTHEVEQGKTSDISIKHLDITEGKDIVMIDVCGQQKYQKTTARAMTGQDADVATLVVAANRGLTEVAEEHLGYISHLEMPLVVAVTREDLATPSSMKQLQRQLINTLTKDLGYTIKVINTVTPRFLNKSMGDIIQLYTVKYGGKRVDEIKKAIVDYGKTFKFDACNLTDEEKSNVKEIFNEVIKAQEEEDAATMVDVVMDFLDNPKIVPVMILSNKTGYYISVFRSLLANLKSREKWDSPEHGGSLIRIDGVFNPPGIGMVVSGLLKGADVSKGDELYMGPFNKEFMKIKVKSLHNNIKQPIEILTPKHRGCLAITADTKLLRESKKNRGKGLGIRKGMVVISNPKQMDNVCYEFMATVKILYHSTSISSRFMSTVHCSMVRQEARITIMNTDEFEKKESTKDRKSDRLILRTDDKAIVKFRFTKRPEYIAPGSRFFFRSGKTIGTGVVDSVLPISKDPRGPEPMKRRFMGKKMHIKRKAIGKKINV